MREVWIEITGFGVIATPTMSLPVREVWIDIVYRSEYNDLPAVTSREGRADCNITSSGMAVASVVTSREGSVD